MPQGRSIFKQGIKKALRIKDSEVGSGNEEFRMNWIINSIKKLPAGGRLLDAGAGEQKFKKYCGHLQYVSQDFAQYDPAKHDSGLQMDKWDYTGLDIVSDIIAIPEPDNSFDAILCVEVIEHIPDPARVFPEFSRLLKPGGILILTAPFCSLTHFAPYHYSTGFSRFYYEKHLPDHGFEITELTENGNYFEYLAQEVRRLPQIAEKYAGMDQKGFDKLTANHFLQMLDKMSKADKGSNELLCFGILIVARKK